MADIRVFVSIPIGSPEALQGALDDLGRVKGVRASPIRQVHITLQFIGDVDERKVDVIEDCVRRACEGCAPFEIVLSGAGAFPDRRRPSVVWIGASPADAMGGIAQRLGANLDRAGIDHDGKRFRPHVTIGRCRGPADLSGFFGAYSETEFARFTCDEVLVMRSVLGPSGAKHSVLRRVPLLQM